MEYLDTYLSTARGSSLWNGVIDLLLTSGCIAIFIGMVKCWDIIRAKWERRKNGKSDRVCVWLPLLLLLVSAHTSLADWVIRVRNSEGSAVDVWLTMNGSTFGPVGTGAPVFNWNISDGWVSPDEGQARVWKDGPNVTPVYTENGDAWWDFTAAGGTSPIFDVAEPPPALKYYVQFTIVNRTHIAQRYVMNNTGLGFPADGITLQVGDSFTLEYMVPPGKEFIDCWFSVWNPDQEPAFQIGISENGIALGVIWQVDDVRPTMPVFEHTWTQQTPSDLSWTLLFEHPNTNDVSYGAGDTNNLTEGTYKAGIQQLYNQQNQQGQAELTVLKAVHEALGGTTLPVAATNMAIASTNLSAAAQDLATAAAAFATNNLSAKLDQLIATNAAGFDVLSSWTNGGPSTNISAAYVAEGLGNVGSASNAASGVVTGAVSQLNGIAAAHEGNYWVVSLPSLAMVSGGPTEMDMGPFTGVLGTVAEWFKTCISWLSFGMVVWYMLKEGQKSLFGLGAFKGSGSGVGYIASVLVCLGAIGVAVAVISVIFKDHFEEWFAMLLPFDSEHQWIKEGMWLLLAWIPLPTLISHVGIVNTFHFVCIGAGTVAQAVIRGTSAAILVGAMTLECQAHDWTVENRSGSARYVGQTNGAWWAVSDGGGVLVTEWTQEFSVWDGSSNVIGTISPVEAPFDKEGMRARVLIGGDGITVSADDSIWEYFREGMYLGAGVFCFRLILYVLRLVKANQGEVL